jgi:tetratricopeptide (TPR) repeat protein
LTRYRELAPREANPLDSLGDVLYHFGAFEQAAKAYQDAFHADPAFLGGATLYKAARSKLMLGDLRAAEELFGRYAELRRRAGDALYPLAVADWLYLTGRRDAARAALNPLANRASNDLAALARARLSLWDLLEGRQEKAAAESRSLLRTPISPLANATALLVVVAAQAPGWESVPEGPFRQLGIACHLLLTNRFEEAAKILKPLVDATDPLSQDPLAVLLAWALVESGRAVDAAQLLATYGTPPAGIEPPLAPWTLPRVFALQAKTFAAQGRTQESQRADSIYRRLTSAGR